MSDIKRTAAREPLEAALVECRREYGLDFQCLLDGREPVFKCHLLPRSIQRLLFAIGAALEPPEPVCHWRETWNDDKRGMEYVTDCGGAFRTGVGNYCKNCGARMVEVLCVYPEEEVTP